MSDLQTSVSVASGAITGTLKYCDTGALAADWGEGNFLVLKFTGIDEDATQCFVGLEPSVSSGLVDIIPDPDRNGVFKVTDKNTQKLVVMSCCDGFRLINKYDLSGLTCETADD